MELRFTVNKDEVYEEVSKTTAYTGSKMEDTEAYERIFTTDEDKTMLERFWNESKNTVCNSLKKVLSSEVEVSDKWVLSLSVSTAFDESLTASMERSLFSFMVMNITAKWYTFTNKEEATGYASEAASYIEDMMRKAYYKKKPTRPTYD